MKKIASMLLLLVLTLGLEGCCLWWHHGGGHGGGHHGGSHYGRGR